MKISFLGTNGWYDTKTGNTVCTLVETEKYFLIFDAGTGFYKIDRYIKKDKKPIYLFFSHYHLDHIIGLHSLAKFNFPQGIKIFGQTGTKRILKKIVNIPYSKSFMDLSFKIEINDLFWGIHKIPFLTECRSLVHVSSCVGYRIIVDKKVIAYCTDTGPCRNLNKLAKEADVLISECSLRSGEDDGGWPHLNPEQAAGIAKECGVKKLVLTHFDSYKYLNLAERKKSQARAREIFPETIAAFDDKKIEI